MHLRSLIAVAPLLAGCVAQEHVDCTALNWTDLSRCEKDNQAKGIVAKLLACMPFTEPLKTEGTWVVGFEKNDFFEGRQTPPADELWTRSTGATLIVDEKLYRPTNRVQALQVQLVGRRAICPVGVANPYPIVVQTLQVKRRIGAL